MSNYHIFYSHGGKPVNIEAKSHLDAITKSGRKSVPKAKFVEIDPKIESKHFVVTETDTNDIKYYKMLPVDQL